MVFSGGVGHEMGVQGGLRHLRDARMGRLEFSCPRSPATRNGTLWSGHPCQPGVSSTAFGMFSGLEPGFPPLLVVGRKW